MTLWSIAKRRAFSTLVLIDWQRRLNASYLWFCPSALFFRLWLCDRLRLLARVEDSVGLSNALTSSWRVFNDETSAGTHHQIDAEHGQILNPRPAIRRIDRHSRRCRRFCYICPDWLDYTVRDDDGYFYLLGLWTLWLANGTPRPLHLVS